MIKSVSIEMELVLHMTLPNENNSGLVARMCGGSMAEWLGCPFEIWRS